MDAQYEAQKRMADMVEKEMGLLMLGEIMGTLGANTPALIGNPGFCKLIEDYIECFATKKGQVKNR